jgi:hypothetical protein
MRRTDASVDDAYIGPLEFSVEFNVHYQTALRIFTSPDFPSVKVRNRWKVRRRDAHKYFKDRTNGKAGNDHVPG